MAATDSPLFLRDLGKETGVAWLGPLPTSPGGFQSRAKEDIWVHCRLCEHLKPFTLLELGRSKSLL